MLPSDCGENKPRLELRLLPSDLGENKPHLRPVCGFEDKSPGLNSLGDSSFSETSEGVELVVSEEG